MDEVSQAEKQRAEGFGWRYYLPEAEQERSVQKQLAYFAVMMKARQYDRRFFSRHLQPKVMAIQESNGLRTWSEFAGNSLVSGKLNFDEPFIQMADYLIGIFRDAKEYGSNSRCAGGLLGE